MRTTPKISIALEGECWQDILDEMTIIQECARKAARASRIEAKPDKGIVAPDEKFYILSRLRHVLDDYGLGPEERAEILERVR